MIIVCFWNLTSRPWKNCIIICRNIGNFLGVQNPTARFDLAMRHKICLLKFWALRCWQTFSCSRNQFHFYRKLVASVFDNHSNERVCSKYIYRICLKIFLAFWRPIRITWSSKISSMIKTLTELYYYGVWKWL